MTMSYEIDGLKRDVRNLEFDLTRKVDNETFRNRIHDLDHKIDNLQSSLNNEVYELNRKYEALSERLNEISSHD